MDLQGTLQSLDYEGCAGAGAGAGEESARSIRSAALRCGVFLQVIETDLAGLIVVGTDNSQFSRMRERTIGGPGGRISQTFHVAECACEPAHDQAA